MQRGAATVLIRIKSLTPEYLVLFVGKNTEHRLVGSILFGQALAHGVSQRGEPPALRALPRHRCHLTRHDTRMISP